MAKMGRALYRLHMLGTSYYDGVSGVPPYFSISMESPVCVQNDGPCVSRETRSDCERSFSTTLDLGGQFLCVGGDGVVVLDSGDIANPVSPR